MEPALKTAVKEALADVQIRIDDHDVSAANRLEYGRLRKMREDGLMRPLAARLSILAVLGWRRTEMAEALDVSRVTINNWLRDHTDGADTFKAYGPDALEGDPDSEYQMQVKAPVVNKLTQRNAESLGEVTFQHDKFVVPHGIAEALDALWRVAYRARGHDLTTDPEVAAAGDALDVLISILLRRGVTNLAIAKAAGVTHRAVLDRMNRARQRGILLNCGADDSCEAFYREDVVREAALGDPQPKGWDREEWLSTNPPGDFELVPIRITSARPSRYWLQTMVDTSTDVRTASIVAVRGPGHLEMHTRLHMAKFSCFDDYGTRVAYDELSLSALLGRMNEDSEAAQRAARLREGTMFVPAFMLYTETMERTGRLPKSGPAAIAHVPAKLWDTYFEPFPLVQRCFNFPDDVRDEYEPTVKHKPDAKTRVHPVEAASA